MSIFRSILVCCLISLLAGIALLFFGRASGYEQFRGGYAVISTNSSAEDSVLREHLNDGINILAGAIISESTQWVYVDNFGSLDTVPLDQYSSRLFSFDPRIDGYADKLKNVFVRDDKRFVYVPLMPGNWTGPILDKQFKNLLKDIPFFVEYFGLGKPLALFFISYIAASLCILIICLARKNMSYRILNIFTLIPVLSCLAFFGAAGIGAASLIFGFFFLLKEPLNELASMSAITSVSFSKRLYKEILKPYKRQWRTIPLFAFALGILVVFTPLKLLFLIAIFFAALAIFYISSKILSKDEGSRRRFIPVTIVNRKIPETAFYIYMLPFTFAAVFTLFFTPFMSISYVGNTEFDALISEQDYYDHITYQATFSMRQMGYDTNKAAVYTGYMPGEGGLPVLSAENVTGSSYNQNINFRDYPPFPLKHLMDFFISVNNEEKTENTGSADTLKEGLALTVLLLFIFFGIFDKNKDRKRTNHSINEAARQVDYSDIQKPAGKIRKKGINRKMSYSQGNISSLHIYKTARAEDA